MKKIFTDYPKILLFACAIVISYLLYRQGSFHWITQHLDGFSYVSIFIAGMLYSFGFTAPFAVAFFVDLAPQVSLLPATLVAAIGASVADVGIFEFVTVSMHEEFARLRETRIYQRLYELMHHETIPERLRRMMRWILAGIIIGSPFPDEIGMTLLAGLTRLEGFRIAVFCFVMNLIGILTILALTR